MSLITSTKTANARKKRIRAEAVIMLAQAKRELAILRELGFKRADFVKALSRELELED
jgi:hypothetical protein